MTIPQMSLVRLAQKRSVNVGSVERAASAAAGWKLVQAGLKRRSLPGLALASLGAMLLKRGATGRCPVYTRLGVVRDPARSGGILRAPVRLGSSVIIHRPRQEVYAFWRDLEQLGRTLSDVVDVRRQGSGISTWTMRLPQGRRGWTACITEDAPNQLIAWESVEPSDVQHEGAVRFFDWDAGRETLVLLEGTWMAPTAALAGGARRWTHEALRRVKARLETGQVPQAHAVSARRNGRAQPKGAARNGHGAEPRTPDPVEQAGLQSFPASDAPGWTLGVEPAAQPGAEVWP